MSSEAITSRAKTKPYALITIWRAILTLQIVMVHCFAIYSSSWEIEFGENTLPYVPAYSWVNPFMAIFALQGFFFISGYHSSMKRKEEVPHEYLHFVKKKFSRLYAPSIIFSLLYLYFFTGHPTWGDVGYAAFSGKGHLWFLPTLFWVAVIYESVACWASRHKYIVLIGFFILIYLGFLIGVLFSDLPINLFVRVTKYLFFYALGACLWQERTERASGSDIDREPLWHVVGIFASGLLLWLTSYTSLWGLLGNGILSKTYTAGLDPLIALLMIIGMYKSWMMLDTFGLRTLRSLRSSRASPEIALRSTSFISLFYMNLSLCLRNYSRGFNRGVLGSILIYGHSDCRIQPNY